MYCRLAYLGVGAGIECIASASDYAPEVTVVDVSQALEYWSPQNNKDTGKTTAYALERYGIPFCAISGDIMSQTSHTAERRYIQSAGR